MSNPFQNEIQVVVATQKIFVSKAGVVSLVNAGPVGPVGLPGDYSLATDFQNHLSSATPHPAYDDIASLSLLFENGLI
jgi:hypothetical protein